MAPLKLYYYYQSPPSRAVLLLIKYLELEHEVKQYFAVSSLNLHNFSFFVVKTKKK